MRYLPLTQDDRRSMLARIGAGDIDALFADVPADVLGHEPIAGLPLHRPEMAVDRHMEALAQKVMAPGQVPSFLGAGVYSHHVPASVDHIIQRGEFLTTYTPYQPEVAQGTLQSLFEFQTQVAELTGMEVANASMYDGSTACAEAVAMAARVTRRNRSVISGNLHPHYAAVVGTHADLTGAEIVSTPTRPADDADALIELIDEATACVVVQSPDLFGNPRDLSRIAEAAHAKGALLIAVVTEIVSLGLLPPPGEMGADIVVAEGQSLGVATGFGGPHVGLFAAREAHLRQLPGRLCGETTDAEGRRGYVLTLSTREQHIRREKATSNICTNAGLCALAFNVHLTLLGGAGLMQLARLNHEAAQKTARRLADIAGVEVLNEGYFNEFTLRLPKPATEVVEACAREGVLAGVPLGRLLPERPDLGDLLLVAATELTDDDAIEQLARSLEAACR